MVFEITSTPVNACRAVKCSTCGKTTWAGCGKHVETVMKDVKDEDKCTCKDEEGQEGQAEQAEQK